MTCDSCKKEANHTFESNKLNVCLDCYAKRIGGVLVEKSTEEMVECDNCKQDTNQEYFRVNEINLCQGCYVNKVNAK